MYNGGAVLIRRGPEEPQVTVFIVVDALAGLAVVAAVVTVVVRRRRHPVLPGDEPDSNPNIVGNLNAGGQGR